MPVIGVLLELLKVGTGGIEVICSLGAGTLNCFCECAACDGSGYVGDTTGLALLVSDDVDGEGRGRDRALVGETAAFRSIISTSRPGLVNGDAEVDLGEKPAD